MFRLRAVVLLQLADGGQLVADSELAAEAMIRFQGSRMPAIVGIRCEVCASSLPSGAASALIAKVRAAGRQRGHSRPCASYGSPSKLASAPDSVETLCRVDDSVSSQWDSWKPIWQDVGGKAASASPSYRRGFDEVRTRGSSGTPAVWRVRTRVGP